MIEYVSLLFSFFGECAGGKGVVGVIRARIVVIINFSSNMLSSIRNEKNQLLLGIRRANRPQTVMPSSVLSSDSMHIGLLAAAAHAAATNSRFTIFYNPRWVSATSLDCRSYLLLLINQFSYNAGLVHLSLWYPWPSMLKLSIIHGFLWACDLGCCLKQKSQVSVGRLIIFNSYIYSLCLAFI